MATQGFPGVDLPLLTDDEGSLMVRTLEDDGTEREQAWRGATGQETMAGVEVRYGAAVVARFPPEMVVTWQQVPWTMTRARYLEELERSDERLIRGVASPALTAEGLAALEAVRMEVDACPDDAAFARWYAAMMADRYAAIHAFTEAAKTDEDFELRDFMAQWEVGTRA